jgi:hypothetical protein
MMVAGAMAEALLSQEKGWWLTDSKPPSWPAVIFAEAMTEDRDATVRACAAVLLNAVLNCFPSFEIRSDVQERRGSEIRQNAQRKAERAIDVPATFWLLAERIEEWGDAPRVTRPPAVPGGQAAAV